jgi:hypothetical protein
MEFALKDRQIKQLFHLRKHRRSFMIKSFIGFVFLIAISFYPISIFFFIEFEFYDNWFQRHKLQLINYHYCAIRWL